MLFVPDMRSSLFCNTVILGYRRFCTAFRSNLQRSCSPVP